MQSFKHVQKATDWSHGGLVQQALQQALMSSEQPISVLLREFGMTPEQTLELTLAAFQDGDFRDRWDLSKLFPQFVRLGLTPEAIAAPLIALLQDEDEDPELRWFAARILGEFDHPSVLTTLIELLQTQSADEDVQDMVATAVAGFGAAAIAPLTPLLQQSATRQRAVQTLAQIRHSATLPALLSILTDADSTIRAIALEALGSFHDARVAPVLMQALGDPAASVRRVAVNSLGFRADLLPSTDLVSILQPLLWDPQSIVRQQAAIALGRLGSEAAVTALQSVLQSNQTDLPLKIEAVRALGWMNTAIALQVLQQVLSPATRLLPTAVAREVVIVLGRIERPDLQPQAAQTLQTLLQQQHPLTLTAAGKQAIAFSLGNLGQHQAIRSLIELLADPDMRVHLHALSALKQLDAELSQKQLRLLMQDASVSEELRRGVAIALAEWHQPE